MRKKSSSELTVCFLLMAALCIEAVIIKRLIYYPSMMSWTEARLHCQKKHIDLFASDPEKRSRVLRQLMKSEVRHVWVGLVRDREIDSVWKWINLRTGEGISGDDVSQSINWADGQQSQRCAAVLDEDLMWHSHRCSSKNYFYCSSGGTIHYHKIALSWYTASQYCQEKKHDLATITQSNTGRFKKTGWIGLHHEDGDTWSWIGDLPSDYRNWAPTEPHNADCASFNADTETFYKNVCSKRLHHVCYDDNLVVVNENKTWEEALSHCMEMETPCVSTLKRCKYNYNLLSLDDLSDYSYVRDRIYRATTDEVWTGLRFLGGSWWWVNGHQLEDQGMLPGCPSQWKHCGTLSKYDTSNWTIRDCSERRNFVCYKY